jgi:acyl dehydratase
MAATNAVRVISSIEEAIEAVGQEFGVSDWMTVDQDRIDAFANATGDHQWIHLDVERARAESPYRSTIAHGFLTLSLIPALSKANYRVENAKMGINYGLNPMPLTLASSQLSAVYRLNLLRQCVFD